MFETAVALAALFGVWALIIAGHKRTVRALERRGLPRWHAWFGWMALLEILFIKPTKPRRRREKVTNVDVIVPRLEAVEPSERPVPVIPKDEEPG